MSLIWSNCCQDNPCKPECTILYNDDIKYKADFNRLFNPEENYQSGAIVDTNNDGLPDGADYPYTFSNGKINLHYISSSDTFIQDGVVDNIGFFLPIDIEWSQENQEYQEEYTLTLGNLIIHGETTGSLDASNPLSQHFNYETSIQVNGNQVYYVSNLNNNSGSIIERINHYIIRYNNRVYYIIGDQSVYEGTDSSGLTGTLQLDYSFISEVVIDENNSSPAQTTITFGAATGNSPLIWRPDKWQYFQEFQTFSNLNTTSDQDTEAITDIYQNDRNEREGCLQPSNPEMVEKGVTFSKCFPQVAVKFYGFKNNRLDNTSDSRFTIPGRITNASVDGQGVPSSTYPSFNIAEINAEAQVYYNSLTATSHKSVYWANGATVSLDYTAVEAIVFNAVLGDENTIMFEPMNPVDVMTNSQAYYGVVQDANNYSSLKGFFYSYKNQLTSVGNFISADFKNCRANPFTTFDYSFKEDGSYSYNSSPTYYGTTSTPEADNGFQLNNITLTVFKGVAAPTIHVSIAPLGKFNFVFENCDPYLAQADIDNWNNSQWPRLVELKRAGIVDTVYTTGSSIIGVTRTTTVFDANFSDFTIDSSKRDNRPVTILQYADSAGNQSDKYFEYIVTDQYGAQSTGTVYIHFDSSAPNEVTQFFESAAGNLTGLDYDLVCKLMAEPSMYTENPIISGTTGGNLIELYYVHDGKQLDVSDLINITTPNKLEYLSLSNKIVHNFPLNQNIIYSKWISWGGVKQDEIYAEFIPPDNHSLGKNRYALYGEYTSSGVPSPLTVDHCVLSVSMHQGTEDYRGYITWIPLSDVYGVYLNPYPITEIECSYIDRNCQYAGVGHFLVYTDLGTGAETWVAVPFSTTPILPYDLIVPMPSAGGPGAYWYDRIVRISDNTVPVIIGIRIDGVTVHYINGSQETVYLAAWNSTGDPYIK